MPIFKYTARGQDGKSTVKRSIEARNYAEAHSALVKSGLVPIHIVEVQGGSSRGEAKPRKMSLREVAMFCRQFSTMLSAGVTLVKAFDILRTQAKASGQKNLALVYNRIYSKIHRGESLFEAMSGEGNVFPPMLVNMVRAGEVSGNLDTVMERTAEYFFSQNRLRNKIKTGTSYPKILLFMTVAIVLALFTFVLPQFFVVFETMDIELPQITIVVVAISNFITQKWYVVLMVAAGIFFTLKLLMKNPSFAFQVDVYKTKIPVVKVAISKIAIANFTATMGVLYASGVDMLESIEIAKSVIRNRLYEQKFSRIITAVESGSMLSVAMEQEQVFEPMVASMLFIGEESGNLEQILESTSKFYENEADEAIARMIAVMEPVMIIVIGIIVLALVASVILPSFSLASGINGG